MVALSLTLAYKEGLFEHLMRAYFARQLINQAGDRSII